MKPHSNISEILLFTTTTFSKRQLCEMNVDDSNPGSGSAEQLEAACWNGLLHVQLPEIMHTSSCKEKVFLWQVEIGNACLKIRMGSSKPVLEHYFTLEPEIILKTLIMN